MIITKASSLGACGSSCLPVCSWVKQHSGALISDMGWGGPPPPSGGDHTRNPWRLADPGGGGRHVPDKVGGGVPPPPLRSALLLIISGLVYMTEQRGLHTCALAFVRPALKFLESTPATSRTCWRDLFGHGVTVRAKRPCQECPKCCVRRARMYNDGTSCIWKKYVPFVAPSLWAFRPKHWKKYDLLPPVCG